MASNATEYSSPEHLVNEALKIAQITDKMMPFEKEPITAKVDVAAMFVDFAWPTKGATRKTIEDWIKEKTGYTSNWGTQSIINEAIGKGFIKKNLSSRKYQPGDMLK